MSDMARLALEVLRRALDDAIGNIPDINRKRPIHAEVVAEARAFWESDEPEWRQSRETLCDAAGVHPDRTRAAALHAIAKAAGVPIVRMSRSEMIRRDFADGMTVPQLVERHGMGRSGVYKALESRKSRWA